MARGIENINNNVMNACKVCKNRDIENGCHDTCIKYTAEILESLRIKDLKDKQRIIDKQKLERNYRSI